MRRLICGLGILGLVFSAFAQSAATKKKVTDLKQKNKSVEKKLNDVQKELHGVKVQKKNLKKEIERVDGEMTTVTTQIDTTRDKLKEQKHLQNELGRDLDAAGVRLNEVRDQLGARVRAMYKAGDESAMLVLVKSRNLAQFASRKAVLERIADRDRDLFTAAREIKIQIAEKKAQQDKVVEQVRTLEIQQKKQLDKLQGKRNEKHAIVVELTKDQAQLESQWAEMEAESRKLENEIAKYQRTSGLVTAYHGKLGIPVSGRRSSPFGYRVHPITHSRKLHTGMDIAAPTGTPISAAGPGRVITAGWMRGYGNTVVIDHGGGLSTLYGHCSRLFVSRGQSITRGQRIAAVGSTGFSTGPHLHFEVRRNGRPVNPAGYL